METKMNSQISTKFGLLTQLGRIATVECSKPRFFSEGWISDPKIMRRKTTVYPMQEFRIRNQIEAAHNN